MIREEDAPAKLEISKKIYARLTGRKQSKEHDIIMYRIIQSFQPGEISPEEANRLGYELAMKFTGGQHQFMVSTHIDKGHLHSHIEFNSTNLNCDGKFQNVKDSAFLLRKLNDELCRAHDLSVIEDLKPSAKKQKEMAAGKGAGYEHWAKIFNLKEAAKRAFDALGGKPIPKVAQLSQEYAALLAEKKEQYRQYRLLRQEMIDYL